MGLFGTFPDAVLVYVWRGCNCVWTHVVQRLRVAEARASALQQRMAAQAEKGDSVDQRLHLMQQQLAESLGEIAVRLVLEVLCSVLLYATLLYCCLPFSLLVLKIWVRNAYQCAIYFVAISINNQLTLCIVTTTHTWCIFPSSTGWTAIEACSRAQGRARETDEAFRKLAGSLQSHRSQADKACLKAHVDVMEVGHVCEVHHAHTSYVPYI